MDKSIQTNNIDTIDKIVQCEITMEEMIDLGHIKVEDTPSKLRWFLLYFFN